MDQDLLILTFGIIILFYRLRTTKDKNFLMTLPGNYPDVTIIVPCRNEAMRLSPTIESLKRIDYPNLKILIVDDNSTDKTFEIASSHAVRVIKAPAKPDNWSGKNWACWVGSQSAESEILLFTDADTIHHKNSLKKTVSFFKNSGSQMVSAPPCHILRNSFEKILGLFHLFPLIATAYRDQPKMKRCFAIGQYLLFDKSSYFQVGGHSAISASLVDDLDMARKFLESKKTFKVYPFADIFSVQMFETFNEFLSGWTRLLRLGLNRSSIISVFEVVSVCAVFILPLLNRSWSTFLFLIIGLVGVGYFQSKHTKTYWWTAVFSPVSVLLFTSLTFYAVLKNLIRKPIKWRQRNYILNAKTVVVVLMVSMLFPRLGHSQRAMKFKIEGLRSNEGKVAYSVFAADASEGFPDKAEKAVASGTVSINEDMKITTKPIPLGDYAITVMHDENGDNRFNTVLLGIPKEGFGFSNNPTILFGPPSVDKVLIKHDESSEPTTIKMKYIF